MVQVMHVVSGGFRIGASLPQKGRHHVSALRQPARPSVWSSAWLDHVQPALVGHKATAPALKHRFQGPWPSPDLARRGSCPSSDGPVQREPGLRGRLRPPLRQRRAHVGSARCPAVL